jgi:hypothetical protein
MELSRDAGGEHEARGGVIYDGSVAWPKATVSGHRRNRVKSYRARFPSYPGNSPALTGKIFLTTVRTVLRV